MAKKKTSHNIAATLEAAAAQLKISTTVLKTAKAAGCKAFRANGNVDCDKLLEDLASQPAAKNDAPDYYLERAKDIRANRMLKEQKLREREKLVWPIEKIRQAWTRNVIACKTKLATSENAVAVEAAMRLNFTADQITALKEIHAKHNRAAMKELFAGEWGKVVCPACSKEISA
jgi:hypothetical protein